MTLSAMPGISNAADARMAYVASMLTASSLGSIAASGGLQRVVKTAPAVQLPVTGALDPCQQARRYLWRVVGSDDERPEQGRRATIGSRSYEVLSTRIEVLRTENDVRVSPCVVPGTEHSALCTKF